jgi:AtzE family amidohydrolase
VTGLALLSTTDVVRGVKAGAFTATAVAVATLDRIGRLNPTVNAYTRVTADRALREAAAVDAAVAAGRDPGPLAGATYSVKNLFDLAGEVTVAGSKINRDDPPAKDDATLVGRLRAAGAVCLGATNMGEYAYDFVTLNPHDGSTLNPHDLGRSAGGSSGGSGAAVAAGLGCFSLGTDTNGSVRVPSSFCGVWGLKPTYGRLSRAGAFLFVASLDTMGVLGRDVAGLAAAFDAVAGPDPRDPVCAQDVPQPVSPLLTGGVADAAIAVLGGYFARGVPQVGAAVATVAQALGATRTIELPQPEIARAAAFAISAAEGGDHHRRRLAERAADFDPGTRDRFIAGALAPAAWGLQGQRFRAKWRAEIAEIFRTTDILLAPATPITAPALAQQTLIFDGVELPLRPSIGLFTQPLTLVGLPVVTAPVHLAGSMPTAVQLVGRPGSEGQLLRAAHILETAGVCGAPVATIQGEAP